MWKVNLSFLKKYTLPVRLIKYQMNTPNKSKKKKSKQITNQFHQDEPTWKWKPNWNFSLILTSLGETFVSEWGFPVVFWKLLLVLSSVRKVNLYRKWPHKSFLSLASSFDCDLLSVSIEQIVNLRQQQLSCSESLSIYMRYILWYSIRHLFLQCKEWFLIFKGSW